MATKVKDLPANGTLEDLTTTCGGHEDGFRAKLARLERGKDADGNNGIRATYNRVPLNEDYVSKELFFFDVTDLSAEERHDITVDQLSQGHVLAFATADRAEVFLEDEEAVVAVYRES